MTLKEILEQQLREVQAEIRNTWIGTPQYNPSEVIAELQRQINELSNE